MKLVHPPRSPDPERLHVRIAQLRMWALEICAWLAGLLGHRMPRVARIMLREDIREALSGARMLTFCSPCCAAIGRRTGRARHIRTPRRAVSVARAITRQH